MAQTSTTAVDGITDDRLFSPPYLWILATNFFAVFNLNIFILLPTFIRELGGTPATIGLVMGTHSLVALIARFWIGGLLDQYGRRRFIMIGMGLTLISSTGYMFVTTPGVLLFACRALHGVAFACYFTAMITLTADTVPVSRRTQALAWTGVAGFSANAIAPAIGEFVLTAAGVEATPIRAYHVLFLFALAISVLALVLGTRTRAMPHEGRLRPGNAVLRVFGERAMRIVFVPTVAMGIGFGTAFMFIKDWADLQGIRNVGLFFLTYSLCVVGLRVGSGRRLDTVNRNAVIFPSLGLLTLGVCLQPFLREQWWLVVLGLCCGGGHGLLYPTLSAMAYEAVSADQRGAAMAVYTMGFDAGLFIGTWSLGFVARAFGYPVMYVVGATMTFAGLLLYAVFAPPQGRFAQSRGSRA